MSKILILGSGGREHAIAWRLSQTCSNIFVHPGNAGTLEKGFSNFGNTRLEDHEKIIQTAKEKGISLVVIGPEKLLAEGYADDFRKAGFLVVGPGKAGAKLEVSKRFAKDFMIRAGVPTARFKSFTKPEDILESLTDQFPLVLKLDGLAAGKGVVIAENKTDVEDFCHRIWSSLEFGPGPHEVLAEEFIKGKEISLMGFCDGKRFIPLDSATDYKRIHDRDQGANTGGMGSVSPSPFMDPTLQNRIANAIVEPILSQMQKEGLFYRGILYIGLMVDANRKPFVLEFNARFGDPETQAILLRMEEGFERLLTATAKGELASESAPQWNSKNSLYVVAAAPGYPESPILNSPIQGLENLSSECVLFFSGVKKEGDTFLTSGGRVLGLGVIDKSIPHAQEKIYHEMTKIHWPGIQYRKDIGSFS
jgi:phosphoribosylamine--glycine ligase